jgi:hypothetical protein
MIRFTKVDGRKIQMSEKKNQEQTAFEVAGIPTPPGQEKTTPTDLVSGAVEIIMDRIQHTFQGNEQKPSKER